MVDLDDYADEFAPQTTAETVFKQLISQREADLRAFFRKRTRADQDITDLTQEVYLRLLRVKNAELIENPEAYLFTVAGNLLKEQALVQQRFSQQVDAEHPAVQIELAELPRAEAELDLRQRSARLQEVLKQLPIKCQAVVAMYYQQEQSYQQIAAQLDISTNMVKKYLAQALVHCRKRMVNWR